MTWGGAGNQRLYITTPSAIYRIKMNAEGIDN